MEQEPNQAGGETIWVVPEESLDEVPASHRALNTEEIRQAFASPKAYFLELAKKVSLPGFALYLEQLATTGRCALLLATAEEMFGGPRVAFQWWVPSRGVGPRQLLIEPGKSTLDESSAAGFQTLFSHVRWLHWAEIGCSGGLLSPHEQPTLKQYGSVCNNKLFPATTTCVFGNTECGDMLIYNRKGEAGFLSHENGKAHSLGSVADALNWIFEDLRQGRSPNFDYERL